MADLSVSYPNSSVRQETGYGHSAGTRVLSASAVCLLMVFAILAGTRILGITNQSLWFDEGYTVVLASASSFPKFLQSFAGYTTSEHLQPLYYFLIYGWAKIAGVSDAALRLPSALFSAGSSIAAFAAMRFNRCASRRAAFVAAGFVALSSYSIYYAQEARPYAMLQCLSMLLLAAWLKLRFSPSTRRTIRRLNVAALACVSGLCALGSVLTGTLVLMLSFADLLISRDLRKWWRLWRYSALTGTLATTVCGLLLLFDSGASSGKDITLLRQPIWMNAIYTIYGILFGTTMPPPPELLRGSHKLAVLLQYWPVLLAAAGTVVVLGASVALLIRTARRRSAELSTLALTAVLYTATLLVAFAGLGHLNLLPRHAAGLFSLVVMLVGYSASLASSEWNHRTGLFWFALGCWVVLNLVSVYNYRYNSAFRKDDYRGAAQYLKGNAAPVFMPAGQPILMRRYGLPVNGATELYPSQLSSYIGHSSHQASSVTVVMNRYRGHRWQGDTSLESALASQYACTVQQQFSYLDIYQCQKKSP